MKNLIVRFLFSIILISSSSLFPQTFWQQSNGPFGGETNSLVINSSGTIYAGTMGGVFRSTDNGENWLRTSTGMQNVITRTLAINSSGHIYRDIVWRSIPDNEWGVKLVTDIIEWQEYFIYCIQQQRTYFCRNIFLRNIPIDKRWNELDRN